MASKGQHSIDKTKPATTQSSGKKRRRKAPIILTTLLVIILAAAAALLFYLHGLSDSIALKDDTIKDNLTSVEAGEPYWTLILGSDSREEDTDRARSDVMMLARVDQANKQVTLISIPRDTYVHIPGYGHEKINTAFALGGAQLAIDTVEEFAGIEISHYAEIYFSGLEELVNTLGGVTVNVPEYCSYADVTLYPGEQTLNGHQALIFARCRKTYSEGDFTRTQCQRILVQALLEKILAQNPTQLPDTIRSIAGCFSTDLTISQLISLATSMQGMTGADMYSAMAPSSTGERGGISYTYTYINQWKLLMWKASEGQDPTLDEQEAKICGFMSTNGYELNMTEPLDDYILQELQAYWDAVANGTWHDDSQQDGGDYGDVERTETDGDAEYDDGSDE